MQTTMNTATHPLSWHGDADVTPTPRDVGAMADVLEGNHGVHASDIAEFFSTHHALSGDAGRCWAWAGVADIIKRRVERRTAQS